MDRSPEATVYATLAARLAGRLGVVAWALRLAEPARARRSTLRRAWPLPAAPV